MLAEPWSVRPFSTAHQTRIYLLLTFPGHQICPEGPWGLFQVLRVIWTALSTVMNECASNDENISLFHFTNSKKETVFTIHVKYGCCGGQDRHYDHILGTHYMTKRSKCIQIGEQFNYFDFKTIIKLSQKLKQLTVSSSNSTHALNKKGDIKRWHIRHI